MTTTVLAQDQLGILYTDIPWLHDFIGFASCQHAMLMNTGLVCECVFTDNCLVARYEITSHSGQQVAGRRQSCGINADLDTEVIGPGTKRHHNLFECTVTGALADTVKRAFNLCRTAFNSGKGVRYREPQVVVAMCTHIYVFYTGYRFAQPAKQIKHLCRG